VTVAEVGEHAPHERLVGEERAERAPVRGVMRRLLDRLAHPGRGAEHAVEPRVHDRFEDRPDAAPLLSDERRLRTRELDLRGRVGAVAELVLESPDAEALPAREQEAGEPGRCLREDEEGVRRGRRAEPLLAVEDVPAAGGRRPHRVGAQVGAALTLGHRHAAERAAAVLAARQPRLPLRGEPRRRRAQCRHRRVRHRHRTAVPGLDLRREHEERGARDVRAAAPVRPRERMQTVREREPHQFVPGWMELDLAVVADPRWMLVREPPPLERLSRQQAAERGAALGGPCGALARERLHQRPVLGEEIVALERRRLVHTANVTYETGKNVLRSPVGVKSFPSFSTTL